MKGEWNWDENDFKTCKIQKQTTGSAVFLILLSAFGQMLLPALLSKMISLGVVTGENRTIWMFAAIMAGVAVFSCLISFGSVKIASGISTSLPHSCETKFFYCSKLFRSWLGSVWHSQLNHPKHIRHHKCSKLFDIVAPRRTSRSYDGNCRIDFLSIYRRKS